MRIRDEAPPIPGNGNGTGLRVWLVYWIVDICDGTLSFDRTDDDAGNVVTVRLSRAR